MPFRPFLLLTLALIAGCAGSSSTTTTGTSSASGASAQAQRVRDVTADSLLVANLATGPDAIEPTFVPGDLYGRVHYPEQARRNGIEGTVRLRILIDETGTPMRYIIDHSDNEIFNEVAINAAMKTSFTPAMQNGIAKKAWVTIPVTFAID